MNVIAKQWYWPSHIHHPTGLASWQDHWNALGSWTGDELGESLGLGAMATDDGFIPFSDPFQLSGGYSGCEDGAGFSKGAGQVAFGAAAVGTGVGVIGKAAPATLYHFTSSAGYSSIMSQGMIRAGSGLFGRGVYVSAFSSPFIARLMGAQSTEKCVRIAGESLKKAPTLIPGAYRILQDVGSKYFK